MANPLTNAYMEMLAFDGDGQKRFVTFEFGAPPMGCLATIRSYMQHILEGCFTENLLPPPMLVVRRPGKVPQDGFKYGVVTNRTFTEAMYQAHAERFGPGGPTRPDGDDLRFRVKAVLREDTPVDILVYLNHQSNLYPTSARAPLRM